MNTPAIVDINDTIRTCSLTTIGIPNYVAFIPLNKIDYEKWDSDRYERNKMVISSTQSVIPIIISHFDEKTKKYKLIDGNHRCYCSEELGYNYIPAIVYGDIIDTDFIIICKLPLITEDECYCDDL